MSKTSKSRMKKRTGLKAHETGKKLEDRVASWLRRQGYVCSKRVLARGKIVARPYEVDIYATKGLINKHHIWVECKAYTMKRSHVTKLIESARDVKDLNEEHSDVQKWAPNMLMLVSNKGFDVDAVALANKYKIYCVKAGKAFEFVGKEKKADMTNLGMSKFD